MGAKVIVEDRSATACALVDDLHRGLHPGTSSICCVRLHDGHAVHTDLSGTMVPGWVKRSRNPHGRQPKRPEGGGCPQQWMGGQGPAFSPAQLGRSGIGDAIIGMSSIILRLPLSGRCSCCQPA